MVMLDDADFYCVITTTTIANTVIIITTNIIKYNALKAQKRRILA